MLTDTLPKGKKSRTKEKIFRTAMSLFLEQGYENTTVQQITEQAEVAKGTFFSHFPTKDSILTFLGEQRIALMKEHLTDKLYAIPSPREKLLGLFDILARENEKDKKITKLIFYERLKTLYSPEFANESKNQMELKKIMESILTSGQKTGEFREDFQAGTVADILYGIYFFTLFQWLATEQPSSLNKEYHERVSIVLKGISLD